MLDLGNGAIFLNNREPLPFVCPQCDSPVPYAEKPLIQCPTCYHAGNRNEFKSVQWSRQEIN